MIDRYTIKFNPAMSQKELEKELHETGDISIIPKLHKMKAGLKSSLTFRISNKSLILLRS